jgi:uncharacterized protein (TIGR04255 family)
MSSPLELELPLRVLCVTTARFAPSGASGSRPCRSLDSISGSIALDMAEPRHLTRAPITEGLIDFRVEAPTGVSVDQLVAAIAERGNFGYMAKGPIVRSEFGFSLDAQQAHASSTSIGVRLHSPDERYVALLSIEGFTFSRLEPYQSWEDLLRQARPLWEGYVQCLGPGSITRIATRYINNLRLPRPELEHFLNLVPLLPEGLPPAISGFLQRYVLQDSQTEATVLLTEALPESSPGPPVPVILDVDAFRAIRFSINDPAAWQYLEQLRVLKNSVFFKCLTEAAVVELYE